MSINIYDLVSILLFFIAFFGLIINDNIVKSIVLVVLMQTGVILFWLGVGARYGVVPPIFEYYIGYVENPGVIADPLPQALMLTAIIIGIAVTAVNIVMLNTLFRKYKSVSWKEMEKLVDEDELTIPN